ncbi:hypothetical protein O5278_24185 [Escherichia coli]|nr:hypothetical protein [Escherichia coli]EGB64414.1 hypothetical protein ERHG_04813 [Escherichia coli TA007]OSL68493.1 hypothetical protein EAWG_05291 [Escherichia coli TA008]MCO5013739.1 hypothetical protein [Escherichia coli]MCZ6179704.1 hypothetical protein [Escherichia coli]MDM8903804.1 hypothetical protein [Escherichia coli]
MEQFKQFSIEKQAAINSLLQLRGMLEMLGEMGINISDDLQKVTSAINAIESDVLVLLCWGRSPMAKPALSPHGWVK